MNKADRIFIENITRILKEGSTDKNGKVRPVYKDGTPAYTIYVTQVVEEYDISKAEIPITTLRPIPWKSGVKEILWIYQDQSNDLKDLKEKYNVHWWDDWDIGDGTIGQRYGATVKKYKLMDKLLEGLTKNPYGRRHQIDLWQEEDFLTTKGLKPCAFLTLWTVRDQYLDLTLIQRSSDYLVAGHINKMQYVALQMMVAKATGYIPGKFIHFVQNLHIYDRHLEQAEELLKREPSDLEPKLILDTDKTDFYSYRLDDFKMKDYKPKGPQLKFELGI
jgi:thymidylate synthase